ncbi:MAG: cation diffusion facilitator family transporter [Porticoccaceae bacterium]|jgi:ferrous-iron efflux pump FieF|nr:cation diffusion facilitator family transporter [Alphaproteobacteria bacterium]MDP4743938.1 cation diffusion facilitator family transporter [Porticoccaceae bacterium]MDP4752503.1 cation diffusion facilitator family transporter [Porticoccaceae bacterium]MDP4889815.1 cation diffusion facilitator family transporter [Porticoccaceae bacterium]MDP4986843.1 cation diffusion facilitator family transporter [Porticoccaceae bacterium]
MFDAADTQASQSQEETAKLLRLATYASTSVAIVLIAAKLFAWAASDSVSLLATLIDSMLDAVASIINLVAVRHALTPADKEHRFGHGKAEALAGLSQSLFIAGSAGYLLIEAWQRVIQPSAVESVELGIFVMAISIAATMLLLAFQRHVIKKTNSTAIRADALHYRTDLMVNGSVIVALLLANAGWPGFDGLFAGAIAIYILFSARDIIVTSYDHLMDRELPDEDRQKIKALVMQHPKARGLHDLRSRHSGTMTFIQLHLELDDDLSLMAAHKISDEVELSILNAFPGSEILIHIDPKSAVKTAAPSVDPRQ